MLAKRIIPTMLCRGRALVKGRQFAGDRVVGHVQQAARVHAMRGVDELVILDIGATAEGRGPDLDLVRELSDGIFIPITVGGGIRTLSAIDDLLRAGADKVACCSCARERPKFVAEVARHFGSQAIVVVLEHWDDNAPEGMADIAVEFENAGAGELMLQAMVTDGTMNGYALDTIAAVAERTTIPVIASGGCSGPADMLAAIKAGASAVAAGALFQFTGITPRQAAKFLAANGVSVRC